MNEQFEKLARWLLNRLEITSQCLAESKNTTRRTFFGEQQAFLECLNKLYEVIASNKEETENETL